MPQKKGWLVQKPKTIQNPMVFPVLNGWKCEIYGFSPVFVTGRYLGLLGLQLPLTGLLNLDWRPLEHQSHEEPQRIQGQGWVELFFLTKKKTNEFGLDTWFGGPLWDNPYGVLFGGSPWFCTSHGLISLMVFVVTKGPTSWPLFASIAVKFAPEQIHRSKRCQLPKLRQQDLSETKMWGNKNTYPIPLYCLVKKDSQIGGYLNPF